jgi:hypothetical protein
MAEQAPAATHPKPLSPIKRVEPVSFVSGLGSGQGPLAQIGSLTVTSRP